MRLLSLKSLLSTNSTAIIIISLVFVSAVITTMATTTPPPPTTMTPTRQSRPAPLTETSGRSGCGRLAPAEKTARLYLKPCISSHAVSSAETEIRGHHFGKPQVLASSFRTHNSFIEVKSENASCEISVSELSKRFLRHPSGFE